MTKINLIIFHPYSNIGGADLSISKLINNLDHKKYKIEFVCLNQQKILRYTSKKIKIHLIKSSRTLFSIFKVRNIIKKNLKSDFKKVIFLSNQNFANIISYFITVGLEKKLKKIIIERNHISELYNYFSVKDFITKGLIKILMKFTYNNFDSIVGNSYELSRDLSSFIKLKVLNISNPVTFYEKKKKFSKKNQGKILNIGRLEKQKDQMTLINAIKLVRKHRDIKLTIIGHGSEYENLNNEIIRFKLKKNIKILRKISNPKKFYLNSDLLISSSIYEGFPNVIVESLCYGVPVISSNCKSGPKEILMASHGPDIFSTGNYQELSQKILDHFKNPSRLNKKCQKIKKNLKKLNLKNYIKKYDKLFSNI